MIEIKNFSKTYVKGVKAVDNLLANNEISKLRDILLKEMYHFIIFEFCINIQLIKHRTDKD